jgi:hypothetical protein
MLPTEGRQAASLASTLEPTHPRILRKPLVFAALFCYNEPGTTRFSLHLFVFGLLSAANRLLFFHNLPTFRLRSTRDSRRLALGPPSLLSRFAAVYPLFRSTTDYATEKLTK